MGDAPTTPVGASHHLEIEPMRTTTPLACLLAVSALLLAPHRGRADGEALDARLSSLAKKLAAAVKERDKTSVALGDLAGPSDVTSGSGVRSLFADKLRAQGVKIDEKAALRVEGKFFVLTRDGRDEEVKGLVVRFVVSLVDRQGKKLYETSDDLTFKNGGNAEIVKLLGLQVDLSDYLKANPEDLNHEIKRQMKKQPLHLADGKVRTTKYSPFAVEVFATAKGEKPLLVKPQGKDGRAVAELKAGSGFALTLQNSSKYEAAASVTVDGADVLRSFGQEKGRPRGVLIPAGKTLEVKGWLRGADKVDPFVAGKKGTITVCFYHCWTGKLVPPEYEGKVSVDPYDPFLILTGGKVVRRAYGPLVAAVTLRHGGGDK